MPSNLRLLGLFELLSKTSQRLPQLPRDLNLCVKIRISPCIQTCRHARARGPGCISTSASLSSPSATAATRGRGDDRGECISGVASCTSLAAQATLRSAAPANKRGSTAPFRLTAAPVPRFSCCDERLPPFSRWSSMSSRTLTGIISDVSEKNRLPSTVSDSEVIAGRMLGAGDVLQSIAPCLKPWLM